MLFSVMFVLALLMIVLFFNALFKQDIDSVEEWAVIVIGAVIAYAIPQVVLMLFYWIKEGFK